MMTVKFVLIALQLILVFVNSATSAKIQFLVDSAYSISPTDACYHLPENKLNQRWFAKTDTCFTAYDTRYCRGAYSTKYEPGKHSRSMYTFSLQLCNDTEGGPQLNTDITTHFVDQIPLALPNVLESYTDVCTCINIPQYVQDMNNWSLNNHHNGLYAYFEPDCKEEYSEALYIEAGHWEDSWNMHTHTISYNGTTMKIRSFGPAPNEMYFQKSCLKYKIIETELLTRSLKQLAVTNEERMKAHDTKLEMLITEFQSLLGKVDKLGPFHEQAALNLENTKHEFNDKLEKQRDEMQDLADRFNSHIHE